MQNKKQNTHYLSFENKSDTTYYQHITENMKVFHMAPDGCSLESRDFVCNFPMVVATDSCRFCQGWTRDGIVPTACGSRTLIAFVFQITRNLLFIVKAVASAAGRTGWLKNGVSGAEAEENPVNRSRSRGRSGGIMQGNGGFCQHQSRLTSNVKIASQLALPRGLWKLFPVPR